MNLRRLTAVALTGAALSAPAVADDAGANRPAIEPEAFFQGMFRQADVELLLDHLRAALVAAAEGREPPASAALERRAAELGTELRLRGTLAGLALLDALEARARERLDRSPPPAPRGHPPAPSAIPDQDY